MGCGGSKEVAAPQAKEPPPVHVEQPTAPATLRDPSQINLGPTPSQLEAARRAAMLAQRLPDDPDAHDVGPLMGQAATLGWLLQLAHHPEYGKLTPQQLMTQVALPATAARKCRYLDTVGAEAVSSRPVYWIWLEESWHRSTRELVGIVEGHIKFMEPQGSVEQLGIWLDCVCSHASASPESRLTTLAGARDWLSSAGAKPTLMCMERVAPDPHGTMRGSGQGGMHGTMRENGQGSGQGSMQGTMQGSMQGNRHGGMNGSLQGGLHGTQKGGTMRDGMHGKSDALNNSMTLPGSTMGGHAGGTGGTDDDLSLTDSSNRNNRYLNSMASGRVNDSTHAPVMILFRSNQGLHGFQKAQFNSMHVTHLD